LVNAIQSKKEISLAKFIYALGIKNVGEKTAQDLADHFQSLEKLKNATIPQLRMVSDVGMVVALSIYKFFRDKKNLEFIDKLMQVGVKIVEEKKPKIQPLKGLVFVFTGSLESMTREEAKRKVRELGGEVTESVSKRVNYVVVGKEPGSKYEKAKKLGVKTITEKEFLELLKLE
jgi:DNA ligase (NAD+)